MLGGQADNGFERFEEFGRRQMRLGICGPAMHDAMSHGLQRLAGESLFEPSQQHFQSDAMVGELVQFVEQFVSGGIADAELPALETDPFQSARQDPRLGLAHAIQRELETGRAAVDRQDADVAVVSHRWFGLDCDGRIVAEFRFASIGYGRQP